MSPPSADLNLGKDDGGATVVPGNNVTYTLSVANVGPSDAAALSAKNWPEFLKSVGTTLVMKVGGASGPLYGTLFMALGKELPENPSRDDLVRAFRAAIRAVQARGKAERGNKTMLDVLAPVAAHLAGGAASVDSVRKLAAESASTTIPMKAIRGRASFLGDRSIGHMDPGARSSQIIIEAVCDVLEGKA